MVSKRAWLTVCLVLLAGCAEERTPEEELGEHVAELRAAGRFDPVPENPDAARWFARLEELGHLAEEIAPCEEAVGAPRWWEPELRDELRALLDELEPWFEGLEELLADPLCVAALERGDSLAQREPKLLSARNWTNLLSGRAVVAADEGRDGEAIEALSRALDLARVVDDGSLLAAMISEAMEEIALGAVRHVLASDFDAHALRSALEPRLAAAGDPERFERFLDHELVERMKLVDAVWSEEDPGARDEGLAILETTHDELVADSLALVDLVEDMRRARDLCMDIGPYDDEGENKSFHIGARTWHSSQVRRHVARTALAVADHRVETGAWPATLSDVAPRFEDGLPVSPCGHRRVAYEANAEEVRVWSTDRVGSHKGPGHVDLHAWTWPADGTVP